MLATQPKPQCDAFKELHLGTMCNDASFKCKVLSSEISDIKLEEVQRSCYLRVLEKNPSDTLEHDIEVVKTKRRLSEVRAELEALDRYLKRFEPCGKTKIPPADLGTAAPAPSDPSPS